MSADVTAAAAASAAAATASAFLGAAFGLPLDTVCCGLLGSLLGLSAVKESPSTWRAAAQFVGYAIGGALVGTWASSNQIAHNGIAFGVALAGNPLMRLLLSRAEAIGAKWLDKITGANQ